MSCCNCSCRHLHCPNCGMELDLRRFDPGTRLTPETWKEFKKKFGKDMKKHFPKIHSFQDHHDPDMRIIIEQARKYFGFSNKTWAADIYFRLHRKYLEG